MSSPPTPNKTSNSPTPESKDPDESTAPNDPLNPHGTTLHHSLLGPSLLKAGQQNVNQTAVASIIYNASLGSKFFLHEQKRDKQLTERITALLAHKAELEARGVRAEERRVDEQMAMLEKTRDLTQTIAHIDCDAFYASVEELDRPELRDVPMAVGGGVLTTCNYKAREFGAEICPQLVMIKVNFEKYNRKAEEVREVLGRYDARFEAMGCDEAFLNLTAYLKEHPEFTPESLVEKIRAEVFEHAKITVSAGIGPNAKIAKIASNKNKPNGQFRIPSTREAVLSFMSPLPVRTINGIGRVFERELTSIGITTCADIFPHRGLLPELFGEKAAFFLLNCYLGLGRTEIRPVEEYERKSVGTESTFRDIWGVQPLRDKLRYTSEELAKDLEKLKISGRTLVLKVKLDTYQVLSRQRALMKLPRTAEELFTLALPLLIGLEKEFGGAEKFKIRLMGLRVTQLVSTEGKAAGVGVDVKSWFLAAGKQDVGQTNRKVDEDGWEVWPDEEFEKRQAEEEEEELKLTQELADELEIGEKAETGDVRENEGKEMWECPVCGRMQVADDEGFNRHVDFCLSRGAIREAVEETKRGGEREKSTGKRFWAGMEAGVGKRRKETL